MSVLTIHSETKRDAVSVPALFIDEYMPCASGEFVKIYLSLLRCQSGEEGISVSALADFLDCTEKDVLRALKYWERMGLIQLEYGKKGELRGILLLDIYNRRGQRRQAGKNSQGQSPGGESQKQREPAVLELAPAGPERTVTLGQLEGDEDFSRFLYVAEQYIGSPLSRRDCDTFAYLYGQLGMAGEFLEYLAEYCVSLGHRSVRYMETVALDLHRKGILTVEGAKTVLTGMKKEDYAVMKAFGLSGRQPAQGERQMMDKWFQDYSFSLDLVLEACNRTMTAIHKPSFEYADKILYGWKKNGVKTMSDVKSADARRIQEKAPGQDKSANRRKPAAAKQPQRGNQFHNFEQRDYDYDALLKQLNQS